MAVERARARATTIAHASGALDVRFVAVSDPGLRTGGGDPSIGMRLMSAQHDLASGAAGAPTPEDIVIEATLPARFLTS